MVSKFYHTPKTVAKEKSIWRGVITQKPHWCVLLGDPWGPSVVLSQPLCLRGLDLHLSLLGFGLIHLPPVGPLEEATLEVEEEVEEGAWGSKSKVNGRYISQMSHQWQS